MALFLVCSLLHVSSHGGQQRSKLSCVFLIKTIPSWLNYFPKAPSPNTIPLGGLGFQHGNLEERDTLVVHNSTLTKIWKFNTDLIVFFDLQSLSHFISCPVQDNAMHWVVCLLILRRQFLSLCLSWCWCFWSTKASYFISSILVCQSFSH